MLLKLSDIKTVILVVFLAFSNNAKAQDRFFNHNPHVWLYLNLNQSIPVNFIQKEVNSCYTHNFMNRTKDKPGFNALVSLSFFKNIGFDLELSLYNFGADSLGLLATNTKAYSGSHVRTFINDGFSISNVSTGLSYRLIWKNLTVQPRFMVGIGNYRNPSYETYLSKNNSHFKTIEYSSDYGKATSFSPSISINYIIPFGRYFGLGAQFTCEYLYMRPLMSYDVKNYDYSTLTVTDETRTFRSTIDFVSFQAGIIIKIK